MARLMKFSEIFLKQLASILDNSFAQVVHRQKLSVEIRVPCMCTFFNPHRNKILPKRINVRIQHVRPSKCRDDFLQRVKRNEQLRRDAKEKGIKLDRSLLKRQVGDGRRPPRLKSVRCW